MSKLRSTLFTDVPEAERYIEQVEAILDATPLCTLATASSGGEVHANTAFFAYDEGLRLYVLTPPSTKHARNISKQPSVAATVFDSCQKWEAPHIGLQLSGQCRQLAGESQAEAFRVYAARFPALLTLTASPDAMESDLESRFYELAVETVKLLDEEANGRESVRVLRVSSFDHELPAAAFSWETSR